jgi:hypothetical protein
MISVCLFFGHVLREAELPAPCSGCIGGAIRLSSLTPCFVEAAFPPALLKQLGHHTPSVQAVMPRYDEPFPCPPLKGLRYECYGRYTLPS